MADRLALSYRIDRLFEANHARTEPEQTLSAVAAAVSRHLGSTVTANDIEALRTGRDTQPEPELLIAIAHHFAADAAYLVGTDDEQLRYDRQIDFYLSVRNSEANMMALRTRTERLSPDVMAELGALINDVHDRYQRPADR